VLATDEVWQPKVVKGGKVVNNGAPWRVHYMGYKYGNAISLLNAPQKDPVKLWSRRGDAGFTRPRKRDLVGKPNTTVLVFHIGHKDGLPAPFAVTLEEGVKKTTELWYCYGGPYWQTAAYGAREAAHARELRLQVQQLVSGGLLRQGHCGWLGLQLASCPDCGDGTSICNIHRRMAPLLETSACL
jgi:hypothetical protein